MKFNKSVMLAIASTVIVAGAAYAQSDAGRPTPAQMKAVHDCAAKQGVELPEPPAGGPPPDGGAGGPHGAGGDQAGSPLPPPKDGDRHHPPKLTDAQKTILDACFKANGMNPPPPPPHGDPKGE